MKTAWKFAEIERNFFHRMSTCGWNVSSIVDVGASDGAWSRTLAEVFPHARFDLFEPLAEHNSEYASALRDLQLQLPSLHVHPVALGNHAGTQDFWRQQYAAGSSLLTRSAPSAEVIQVSVVRLDEYRAQHNIVQPQLVKIDVQGGELLVLEGACDTVRHADALHIETWLGRGYGRQTPLLHEVMDFVRPLDHILVQLGEYWRKPSQELFVVDAFFVHRRVIDAIASAGHEFPWPQNWTASDAVNVELKP